MSDKQWQSNLLNANVWIRLVYMLLTLIGLCVARILLWLVVIFQFLLVLIAGRDNDNLRNFGQGVSKWVYESLLFLTFNSEQKPFPFSEWPTIEPSDPYTAPEVEPKVTDTQDTPAEQQQGGEAEVELDDSEDAPVLATSDQPAPKTKPKAKPKKAPQAASPAKDKPIKDSPVGDSPAADSSTTVTDTPDTADADKTDDAQESEQGSNTKDDSKNSADEKDDKEKP